MKIVRNRKFTLIMLAVCVGLILLNALIGSFIQTAGWTASVEDLRNAKNTGTKTITASDTGIEGSYTVSGLVVSGILFIPKNATAETPAPAIAYRHGAYNNREMQLSFAIESVRRGYVVLIIDGETHGHNQTTTLNTGDGLLSAAKYLYNLTDEEGNKIVDPTKIGVSGHSMGGSNTNGALSLDGVDTVKTVYTGSSSNRVSNAWRAQEDAALRAGYKMGIISAGLVQACTPSVASYGSNLLGVGNLKASSDEFFYGSTTKEPIYRAINQNQMTAAIFAQGVAGTYASSVDGKIYIKSGDDYVAVTSSDRFRASKQYYRYTTSSPALNYLMSTSAMGFVGLDTANAANLDAAGQYNVQNRVIYVANGDAILRSPTEKWVCEDTNGAAIASATTQIRVVYEEVENHPMNHFSIPSTADSVDFWYNVFGTPEGASYKAPSNQTWWMKEGAAMFGIVGLFGLAICLVDILLKSKLFSSLAVAEGELPEAPELLKKPRKHVSYWLAGILCAWFGYYSWVEGANWYTNSIWKNLIEHYQGINGNTYFAFTNINTIAYWGICCATFAVIVTALIWFINRIINMVYYKDDYLAYDEQPFAGFKIRSVANVFKTILLAGIVVSAFYGVVFFLWNWLVVDFRIWTFDFRIFTWDKLVSMLRYVPFFFIYYMINSAFGINYRVKDLPEWATIAINVAFNVGWLLICVWHFNNHFISTGAFTVSTMSMKNIWTYPIIPTIAVATVVARRLYVRTGNAWLGGLVNAVIVTISACANTSFTLPA